METLAHADIRRLMTNVYTSPDDKTRDAAILALWIAYEGDIPSTSLAGDPRKMLMDALAVLDTPSETPGT